jgi:hypothetical protein
MLCAVLTALLGHPGLQSPHNQGTAAHFSVMILYAILLIINEYKNRDKAN